MPLTVKPLIMEALVVPLFIIDSSCTTRQGAAHVGELVVPLIITGAPVVQLTIAPLIVEVPVYHSISVTHTAISKAPKRMSSLHNMLLLKVSTTSFLDNLKGSKKTCSMQLT